MHQPSTINSRLQPLRDEEMGADHSSPPSRVGSSSSRLNILGRTSKQWHSPFFTPDQDHKQSIRLVRRDSPFHQSSGKIYMHRGLRRGQLVGLARKDWYHVLLTVKSRMLLLTIFAVYTLVIIIFAALYMLADIGSVDGSTLAASRSALRAGR